MLSGEKFVRYSDYNRKTLIKSCSHDFEGMIDLLSNDEWITLKITLQVLNLCFGKDVISTCLNYIDSLEEKLLLLENIDFTYRRKMKIKGMRNHK